MTVPSVATRERGASSSPANTPQPRTSSRPCSHPVMSPDTHAATAVEVIVVWQWLASTDDPTNAWAIPIALCLFVFHTAIALMALTPMTANVDRSILLRWSRRSGYVVVATIGMWALVVVLHERRAAGSAAVTLAGFVTLTVLVVATRTLSAARESRP